MEQEIKGYLQAANEKQKSKVALEGLVLDTEHRIESLLQRTQEYQQASSTKFELAQKAQIVPVPSDHLFKHLVRCSSCISSKSHADLVMVVRRQLHSWTAELVKRKRS